MKARSQSIFLTQQRTCVPWPVPIWSNPSLRICRLGTADLCQVVILTSNIHPDSYSVSGDTALVFAKNTRTQDSPLWQMTRPQDVNDLLRTKQMLQTIIVVHQIHSRNPPDEKKKNVHKPHHNVPLGDARVVPACRGWGVRVGWSLFMGGRGVWAASEPRLAPPSTSFIPMKNGLTLKKQCSVTVNTQYHLCFRCTSWQLDVYVTYGVIRG